jgi:polyisoprenoid-binding protein YceI
MTAPAKAPTVVSTWTIDPAHSSAEFAVKHLMISTVRGSFSQVEGVFQVDEAEPMGSSVSARIPVATIDTGVEQRDAHLRSADFFDVEKFPTIDFRSTKIEGEGDEWKLEGDLTMHGVTRPVVLDVEFEGRGPGMQGEERAGFTATTKLNRKDFGMQWNAAVEAGGVVVGDTVKVTLNIEVVCQP